MYLCRPQPVVTLYHQTDFESSTIYYFKERHLTYCDIDGQSLDIFFFLTCQSKEVKKLLFPFQYFFFDFICLLVLLSYGFFWTLIKHFSIFLFYFIVVVYNTYHDMPCLVAVVDCSHVRTATATLKDL